jgi:hypothetical protein
MVGMWSMYACVLIVCYYFSGDRIERVCGGRRSLEYQEEEDQGQANPGKPSTCCISESY